MREKERKEGRGVGISRRHAGRECPQTLIAAHTHTHIYIHRRKSKINVAKQRENCCRSFSVICFVRIREWRVAGWVFTTNNNNKRNNSNEKKRNNGKNKDSPIRGWETVCGRKRKEVTVFGGRRKAVGGN